jgi:hypothetical protein
MTYRWYKQMQSNFYTFKNCPVSFSLIYSQELLVMCPLEVLHFQIGCDLIDLKKKSVQVWFLREEWHIAQTA